jgi:hypothetical protein
MPTFVKDARNIADALLRKIKALPAAGAANAADSIDLDQVTGGTLEAVEVVLEAPAVANLAAAKTITYTFKDSADGVTFAAIVELATVVQTGAAGTGGADAVERRVRLPPGARRYIRADAAAEVGGGDNTAASYTLSVLV